MSGTTGAPSAHPGPVRFLVCGAGSIGREYALRHLTPQNHAFVAAIADPSGPARSALADLVAQQQAGGNVFGRKYQEQVVAARTSDHDGRGAAIEKGCLHFPSLSEAAAKTGFDAVYVAAPPAAHARLVREAFSLGKHVLLEKPIAGASREDADAVVKLSEEAETKMLPGGRR
eukprot:g18870.t1